MKTEHPFIALGLGLLLTAVPAAPVSAQTSNDPFETPIPTEDGVITVGVVDFATVPDVDDDAPRLMLLTGEPGTDRVFVNDMYGLLYRVSADGREVTRYLDLRSPAFGVAVDASSGERGFQSFALHPEFHRQGADGFGRLYTWTDSSNTSPSPDFRPKGGDDTHDTVLHEWVATDPTASTYDGGPPRELMRFEQPFRNHNGGHVTFNPLASPGDSDYGLLYIGSADGGSGGDPLDMSQDLGSGFGKILRIDPLGSNSANGRYGIPTDNPFAGDGDTRTLGEVFAYGLRNPQRLAWDASTGRMFVSDIGQNIVEEVSPVTAGANLGWNRWEGSYRFISRQEVSLVDPRGEVGLTYPVVEYGQLDPLFQRSSAASGLVVYRWSEIPQLANLLIFADNPSGEIFYVSADDLPEGGQDAMRRILLRADGGAKTLLEMIREKNEEQGKRLSPRADLRLGMTSDGRVFLLNKGDGIVRRLVP